MSSTNSLRRWLPTLTGTAGECEVRLYGGWYEDQVMTSRAQEVSVSMQDEFPAIIRVNTIENNICIIKAVAQLALSLLEEPNHHLFSTYRRKGKPNNIRVETPQSIGCVNGGCLLPYAKNLLKTGRCTTAGCLIDCDSLVYRHEQKIVDTMLACDLLYLGRQNYDQLLIVSDDDDFLPPIRTVILQGAKVIRVNPKGDRFRNETRVGGNRLIEIGI